MEVFVLVEKSGEKTLDMPSFNEEMLVDYFIKAAWSSD
jgi:hypothetical protein